MPPTLFKTAAEYSAADKAAVEAMLKKMPFLPGKAGRLVSGLGAKGGGLVKGLFTGPVGLSSLMYMLEQAKGQAQGQVRSATPVPDALMSQISPVLANLFGYSRPSPQTMPAPTPTGSTETTQAPPAQQSGQPPIQKPITQEDILGKLFKADALIASKGLLSKQRVGARKYVVSKLYAEWQKSENKSEDFPQFLSEWINDPGSALTTLAKTRTEETKAEAMLEGVGGKTTPEERAKKGQMELIKILSSKLASGTPFRVVEKGDSPSVTPASFWRRDEGKATIDIGRSQTNKVVNPMVKELQRQMAIGQ